MIYLPPVITIDGPSGVGKSTLSKVLANYYKWNILDSGAIYRVLSLVTLRNSIDINSEKSLIYLANNLKIHFKFIKSEVFVFFEGFNVTEIINTELIANQASILASIPAVRYALLEKQRNFRIKPGIIADGRDMGTVVFPDAQVKFFLYATNKECSNRRMKQLQIHGINVKFNDILNNIKQRDYRDYNRRVSPLKPAKDAFIIDSSHLSIEEVVIKAIFYINNKLFIKV